MSSEGKLERQGATSIERPTYASVHASTVIHGIQWKFFNQEWFRLITFVNYPRPSNIPSTSLAARGFLFLEESRTLICYFCYIQIKIFQNIKQVDKEHKKSRGCPMVNKTTCNNQPINSHESSLSPPCPNFHMTDSNIVGISSHTSSQPTENEAPSSLVTNTSSYFDNNLPDANHQIQLTIADNSEELFEPSMNHSPENRIRDIPDSSDNNYEESSSRDPRNDTNSDPDCPPQTISKQATPSSTTSNQPNGQTGRGDNNSASTHPNQNNEQLSTNSNDPVTEPISYDKLGIVVARPKRPEFATFESRLKSFERWPSGHFIKPEDLAIAGFYFSGHSDTSRCFYCGGGLRNWESNDNVWIEHARWFSRCPFLKQEIGSDFIDAVAALDKEEEEFTYDEVIHKLNSNDNKFRVTPFNFTQKFLERDPAVRTLVDNGFIVKEILPLAMDILREGNDSFSSLKLYKAAVEKNLKRSFQSTNLASDSINISSRRTEQEEVAIKVLRRDNDELRQSRRCKICLVGEASVVYLPCGHMVGCTECSYAITNCPMCRVDIKGIVRGYIG